MEHDPSACPNCNYCISNLREEKRLLKERLEKINKVLKTCKFALESVSDMCDETSGIGSIVYEALTDLKTIK